MSGKPWMKFYPADWLSDVPLKSCSAAAQGLWIGMLCIMHSARPSGCLVVNGRPMNEVMLAAQTGIPVEDVIGLISQLESAGVFSRDPDGTIYSRRMMRDEEKLERDRANGRTGGNPRLKARHNREDKPEVKAHWPLASPRRKGSKVRTVGTAAALDAEPFAAEGAA